jgi:hypothetical protein
LEHDDRVLKEAGLDELPFETEPGKAANGSDTIYIRAPKRPVKFDLFSKSDLRVFDEIIDKYRDASFEELMNLTHEHEGYKVAWDTRKQGNRAPMFYEEMIDDVARRAALVEDVEPVAAHMQ